MADLKVNFKMFSPLAVHHKEGERFTPRFTQQQSKSGVFWTNRESLQFFLAVVWLCIAGGISQAQSTKPSNEVLIGPVTIPADYVGLDLSVPVRAFLTVASDAAGINVGIRLQGDLGNLQNKIGQVVDAFPVPKNNCASYGISNPVVNIWGKQLEAVGTSAVITLHGYVEIWGCASNPIPNSKIEFRNDGPFNLPLPHLVTWPGDPIKTIIAKQPFDATVPVSLQAVDDHSIILKPGTPHIALGGQYVTITNEILHIAGIDINAKAAEALSHAIDPDKLQQVLPPEVLRLNPKITGAQFVDSAGTLNVELRMLSRIHPDQLTTFLQTMVGKKP